MANDSNKPASVDDYIAAYPAEVVRRLQDIRKLIKDMVPTGTTEVISYGIPGYKKPGGGRAYIYFAGFAQHISMYPVHPERTDFAAQLKPYLSGRATLQFPHDKPLPTALIKKAIKFLIDTYGQD